MSNYATKDDLKDATGVDTSSLVAKCDLASLKEKVNKIDVGKVKAVPVDLYRLNNVLKIMLVKGPYMMN